MNKKTILIVEDDKHISKLLKYNLEKAGFDCLATITGEDALDVLDTQNIDLVILDVMLPKMDGFGICKLIKQDPKSADVPVMMLTAKGEEVDRVVGFELGADDYVVKPFSPRELVLRAKAIITRGKVREDTSEVLTSGTLRLDISRHKVIVNNKNIELAPMEFKLLITLMRRRGRVQSRDVLLNDVWDVDSDVTTRTVDTHIKRLRQKLGKVGKKIETVRSIGYRFNEE